MKNFSSNFILISVILILNTYQDYAQSKEDVIHISLVKYLKMNLSNFTNDTLYIKCDNEFGTHDISNQGRQIILLSYDKIPKEDFTKPHFVLGIRTENEKQKVEIILSENVFKYDFVKKEWIIGYLGNWIYYYNKKGRKYTYKKFTHSSI